MSSGAGQKLYTLPAAQTAIGGVAVPLITGPFATGSILIQADPANVGACYIGDSSVTSDNGIALLPNGTISIGADSGSLRYTEFDVGEVFMVSGTSGNKVRIQCTRRRA